MAKIINLNGKTPTQFKEREEIKKYLYAHGHTEENDPFFMNRVFAAEMAVFMERCNLEEATRNLIKN